MDKQLIMAYVKKLKLAIVIFVAGIVVFGILIKLLVPIIENFNTVNKNVAKQTKSIDDNVKKLEELKLSMKTKADKQADSVKGFYMPVESGLDAETVMAEEFADVLQMIRANSIKTRAVKYDYNPSDDTFVKNASNKYNVCLLSLEMIADYKHFQAFLRDLYKHEHFMEISKIEIVPYVKDKKILLINSTLKLYTQKTEAEVAAAAKAAVDAAVAGQSKTERKQRKR